MSKDILFLLLLPIISIYLLINGYNAVFKTKRFLLKITSRAHYEENSRMFNRIHSKTNFYSVKVGGVGMIIFGIISLALFLLKICRLG